MLLAIGIIVVLLRLKRTRQSLTETSAVLEETIKEMRPVVEKTDLIRCAYQSRPHF